MNISYKRDLDSNYLVLEDERFRADRYMLKMLEKNAPEAFLPLSVKQMNGIVSLWYRITSMQTMERLFERRPMSGEDIQTLMEGYRKALGNADSFLLEAGDIVTDPAFLFFSPDRKQVRFIYVPDREALMGGSKAGLPEYVLRKLDHKDKRAVEMGYGLYDALAGNMSGFLEAWNRLTEEWERNAQREAQAMETEPGYDPDPDLPEPVAYPERKRPGRFKGSADGTGRETQPGWIRRAKSDRRVGSARGGEQAGRADRSNRAGRDDSADREGRAENAGGLRIKHMPTWVPAAGALLLTGVAACLVGWFGNLDAIRTGGLFFGSLAAVWLIIHLVLGRRESRQQQWGDSVEITDEDAFWESLMQGEDVQALEGSEALQGNRPMPGNGGLQGTFREGGDVSGERTGSLGAMDPEALAEEESWIHGQTRALGEVDRKNRLVLVSRDVRRCRDLTVESAITLIGKSRELADIVIPINVISRVHARLDHTKEGIFLTDLNSMNGTFVNETRLSPNERVQVKEGDLISFATVHFKLTIRDY